MNRLHPAYVRQPKISADDYVDPDPRMQAEQARKLSKYMFPRQYQLSNTFEKLTAGRGSWVMPDFEDRESEIEASLFLCSMFIWLCQQSHFRQKENVRLQRD